MSDSKKKVIKYNPFKSFAAMLTSHEPYKINGCKDCERYEKQMNVKRTTKKDRDGILLGWRTHHAMLHTEQFVKDNSKKTFKEIGYKPKIMRKKRKVENSSEENDSSEGSESSDTESGDLRESDYETDTSENQESDSEENEGDE